MGERFKGPAGMIFRHVDDQGQDVIPCLLCAHLIGAGLPGRRCLAFPDGIPDEIWNRQRSHDGPVEGDGGLHFRYIGS